LIDWVGGPIGIVVAKVKLLNPKYSEDAMKRKEETLFAGKNADGNYKTSVEFPGTEPKEKGSVNEILGKKYGISESTVKRSVTR